jgi:hypothetical protein
MKGNSSTESFRQRGERRRADEQKRGENVGRKQREITREH